MWIFYLNEIIDIGEIYEWSDMKEYMDVFVCG